MNYTIAFSAAFLTGLLLAVSPVTDKGLRSAALIVGERKEARNRKEKRGFKPYAKHGHVPLFI